MIASAIASITIYDMCKAIDKSIVINDLRLQYKSGGKSKSLKMIPFDEACSLIEKNVKTTKNDQLIKTEESCQRIISKLLFRFLYAFCKSFCHGWDCCK